ncbi:TetR/AcrR family transcriptional regulator [Jatrophihabitans telluris]|uniref:TetR/AcrR family transcriptional regulator n=1 Tax=Jatrophihabitans telluris TaxID=2038343 RepID=A0ABY4R0K6_9ACTN|nr:TetR family transcriptional regulator [Jatrophihabitans telluris]UQX89002.1 TetR/AcrR family transcriptional regulator [Jatrophihabitans telluris]
MGRTSLAAARREQVLAAFARCIARMGFAGTSLEDVAAEAGLARGHVRHYLGNRHDQVLALTEWISTADQAEFDKVHDAPDDAARVQAVMRYLFDASFYEPGEDQAVLLALFEEARRDDALRKMFLDGYDDILTTMSRALTSVDESMTAARSKDIAYLMLCAAVGNAHLSQSGVDPARARRLGPLSRRVLAMLVPATLTT